MAANKTGFEALHKNHKFAFLDGLLTGSLLTAMVMVTVREYREMKSFELELKKGEETIAQPIPILRNS